MARAETPDIADLLEALPDAMLGVDEAGVIAFVNRQVESLFGYQRDDLVGAPLQMLLPGSVHAVRSAHRQGQPAEPARSAKRTGRKLLGRRRDGSQFPADLALSTMRTAEGTVVIAAVRDIGEYQESEEDRRRLGWLAAIVEHSEDAILSETTAGIITSANPAAERMYGYPSAEMLGKSVDLLIPNGRTDEIRSILTRIRDGESVDHFETVRVRKDGTTITVSLSVSPIRDDSTAIVGASVIARDVTEHRKATMAAQRMAAIVEHSEDAIISSTLEGVITSWNPAAQRQYGYTSDEIIGRSIQPVTPTDRTDEIKAILSTVRAGQPLTHLETVQVRKDGTHFAASLTVSPIHDPDGAIVGASVISRDVTAQRRALETAQRLAAIVEYSDDAIISRTLEGTITSWNPAAQRLFGYSSDEVIGRSASLLTPADYDNEIPDFLARIRTGQPVVRLETTRVRKDAKLVPVSLTVSPIHDADGVVVGASTIALDLSERKRTFESARSMIETSLDSFVAISPQGKITDANEATVKLTGVPRDELIGTSFSDYFTDPEKAEEIYQRVLTGVMAEDYPLTLRHRDGHDAYTEVLFNASAYRDASGKALGVFAAARDVSELRTAAQYARSVIEASLDPLVMISNDGRITDVNEATIKATGVPRDELIGTSFPDYFTDPQKAEAVYQRVFEQGAVTDYPLTLLHRDRPQSTTEVLYNASVYRDTAGNVRGVVAAARDVTKQVASQREATLQQARELERLAELERFQRLTVGRELKMIELKKEIEYLKTSGPAQGGELGDHR